MICPIMSKIVTSPELNKYQEPTAYMRHDLFQIRCCTKECALWVVVTEIPSGKQLERCGLIK